MPPVPEPSSPPPADAIRPPIAETLIVGTGGDARSIATLRRPGGAPGLVWLGGYRSDMRGTKAEALDAFGAGRGLAVTRFDYSGHGASGGSFADGTISRWLEEARAVLATAAGPQVVVGSSMGGWIALLLATALHAETSNAGPPSRIAGLVLIAPAVDMTEALMWERMTRPMRETLRRTGVLEEAGPSGEPVPVTWRLVEDGRAHRFGDRLIETGCPVHILQGRLDREVPAARATLLLTRLASDDAALTLIKDGDHRLSRPQDLALILGAVAGLLDRAD